MLKEETDERCIEIFDSELNWHLAESFLSKLQKQAEAIAICRDSVWARLPLAKQTISKERLKKRGEAGGNHRGTSRGIRRSVAS
jgi:hypothetical protein